MVDLFCRQFQHHQPSRMFKKAPFLPSQPRRAKTRLSTGKAAGDLARGAYTRVREPVKGPRTQLATFFNILLGYGLTIGHPKG